MARAKRYVVVGNGVAGITAARTLRKLDNSAAIEVISDESELFFSRTALMYVYMGHMRQQDIEPYPRSFYKKNRIELRLDRVVGIDFTKKQLQLHSGSTSAYDKLILATGSTPRWLNIPGNDARGVQGLYSLQDLKALEAQSHRWGEKPERLKQAVIAGGGLIGVELCEMLHTRQIEVTMLVREGAYWGNILPPEEAEIVGRHLKKEGIQVRYHAELTEILVDDENAVRGVKINSGEELPCQFVGFTAGVVPNVQWLSGLNIELNRGILCDEFLQTSVPGVFTAGDCAEIRNPLAHRKAIEAVWYTARMMGECAALNAAGRQIAYKPGVWFNSAKFFHIEYQTYGNVPAKMPGTLQSMVYTDAAKEKLVRVVFAPDSGKVVGINALNVRLRHEFFDAFIERGATLGELAQSWPQALFDPEFYPNLAPALSRKCNEVWQSLPV